MENNLSVVVSKPFRRKGFDVKEISNEIEFENKVMKGTVSLKKPLTITWKCKRGYEIFDTPIGSGNSSAQFNKVGELLNFIQRRIV